MAHLKFLKGLGFLRISYRYQKLLRFTMYSMSPSLKGVLAPFTSSQPLPLDLSVEAKLLVQSEQILDNRKNNKGELEVLVK